jgi:glutamate synthase domain-containing protein 2
MAMALGADGCNSARAMMLAVCRPYSVIRIAAQDKSLMKGLVVADKAPRVKNFHKVAIKSCLELIFAAGLQGPKELRREHISKRMFVVKSYDEIYP